MSAKYNISATRLKLLRTKNGLTQQDFASKVGLSTRTYAAYERGERKLPRETAEKIKQIFGITPYDLFSTPSPQKLVAALDEVAAAEEKRLLHLITGARAFALLYMLKNHIVPLVNDRFYPLLGEIKLARKLFDWRSVYEPPAHDFTVAVGIE